LSDHVNYTLCLSIRSVLKGIYEGVEILTATLQILCLSLPYGCAACVLACLIAVSIQAASPQPTSKVTL
jgi:hypothetical protein